MRLKLIILIAYFVIASYAWWDFVRLPPDGLANLGLMLVTFPVAAVGLIATELMGGGSFILLPSRFGYYGDHAPYYWPAVLVTALLLYAVAVALGRRGG